MRHFDGILPVNITRNSHAFVDAQATVASGSLKQSEEPADIAFSGVVRSILYEEAASFKLAGSKGTHPAFCRGDCKELACTLLLFFVVG